MLWCFVFSEIVGVKVMAMVVVVCGSRIKRQSAFLPERQQSQARVNGSDVSSSGISSTLDIYVVVEIVLWRRRDVVVLYQMNLLSCTG